MMMAWVLTNFLDLRYDPYHKSRDKGEVSEDRSNGRETLRFLDEDHHHHNTSQLLSRTAAGYAG